jgi:hypothetical protein
MLLLLVLVLRFPIDDWSPALEEVNSFQAASSLEGLSFSGST